VFVKGQVFKGELRFDMRRSSGLDRPNKGRLADASPILNENIRFSKLKTKTFLSFSLSLLRVSASI
jgi:hypothetical protein